MNKYNYLVILQGNYAHGWEDLCAANDDSLGLKQIKDDLKQYRINEGGSYRIIRRRELTNRIIND